jgi:glycosyltransferase involved in cell wall biosynthesis
VHFLPFSDAMPEFFSALDVFCLPTLHEEGLSRSLIEAMACGVPCVATRVGGNLEALGEEEAGILVPAGDEAALCRALCDLEQDAARRRRLAGAARARAVARFDAADCARRIEAVYAEVAPC